MSLEITTKPDWFEKLIDPEKEIIYCLSVLPEKSFSFPELADLLQLEENEKADYFDLIHDLSAKAVLSYDKACYTIKPSLARQVLKKYSPGTEECSRLINHFLDKLETSGLNSEDEFLPLYTNIKEVLKKIAQPSIHLAQLSYMLSSGLFKINKLDEALEYNQLAVEISEKIDKSHPVVALYYRDKAHIHKKLGDPWKAIIYGLKDIEILEKYPGKYDELLPESYYALSKAYEMAQNYQKAVEYNLKAIKFEKRRLTRKNPNLSRLYHHLAHYYLKLNNLEDASLSINKAVEMYSEEKTNENVQYRQLIEDQQKFNYLYFTGLKLRKFKYPILILGLIVIGTLFWAIYRLIFT